MCGPPPYGARFHVRPHQETEEGIRKKRKDEAVPIANTLAKNAADRKAHIEDIFIPQITDMHGIPFEGGGERSCGHGWAIDPRWGEGTYWYLPLDDMLAVASFDLTFHHNVSFGGKVPNLFCFGSYGRNMIPYFTPYVGVEEGWERGTLLGYAWRAGLCREHVRAGEPLAVTSISLLSRGATEMARRIGCDPLTLTSAIASLDGTHRIPALQRLFEEVRTARLGATAAQAYYACKATEACALLVDWWETQKDAAPRIRAADRTAFNLACAWAREHLDGKVTLADLCCASCVSASKLTALFKTIENNTPLGYVRDLRMETACDLLAHSDEALSSVAAAVGFSRQGSFSEAFRERFGMPPHQYRKLFAAEADPKDRASERLSA